MTDGWGRILDRAAQAPAPRPQPRGRDTNSSEPHAQSPLSAALELRSLASKKGFDLPVLGMSPAIRSLWKAILQIAPTVVTVLLRGETGTGKGFVANLIHRLSPRSGDPFIELVCGALARTLLESELFGHEKGAFTGATATKPGRFELAKGGTIFLDE